MPDSISNGNRVQRPPRSRNGCETCRRRKVRCNERRPRCGHCERLNLQCNWRPHVRGQANLAPTGHTPEPSTSSITHELIDAHDHALDAWDFNNLIWQDTSALDPTSLEWLADDSTLGTNASIGGLPPGSDPVSTVTSNRSSHRVPVVDLNQVFAEAASPASSVDGGSHALVEHFLASDVPPILASVEVGPRWTSTKMLFASLAASSGMVRHAVTAFSALQVSGQNALQSEHSLLYKKAAHQLARHIVAAREDPTKMASDLAAALATVFFLSYSDLLTNRVNDAQTMLRDASGLIRIHKAKDLNLVEKRLISWVRLIDGRASSAGGAGAFLTETEDDVYSPGAHMKATPSDSQLQGHTLDLDQEIEEILFDILYTPGLVFYQRVQSIMARVSNIDPWHRSRGTVSDETEVMAMASAILADLHSLEGQRPALMDHAVAGSLNESHVAKEIALAITRSYRTYWANYEAGFIHLHRVAHKHLPATAEVIRARSTIKKIARLFEQSNDILPVNFIWPLLMACCEEDNLEERAWMIRAIRNMQSLASNARPIADVLEEVHRRQDSSKQRADVRQASMDLFNMSFAVV